MIRPWLEFFHEVNLPTVPGGVLSRQLKRVFTKASVS